MDRLLVVVPPVVVSVSVTSFIVSVYPGEVKKKSKFLSVDEDKSL